jgi:hypothetical protein
VYYESNRGSLPGWRGTSSRNKKLFKKKLFNSIIKIFAKETEIQTKHTTDKHTEITKYQNQSYKLTKIYLLE